MANRLVTQVASDAGLFAAIMFNHTINKLDRIMICRDLIDSSEVQVLGSNYIPLCFNSKQWIIDTDTYVDLDSDLDTGTKAAGKDYYVYACDNSGALDFLISLDSSYPSGYSASTSMKIGGFHTLCVNVGTISGHALTSYYASSILPESVWDLKHRPTCSPEGMVYCDTANVWVDIYLASGSYYSVYNGTVTYYSTWLNTTTFSSVVLKRLLSDIEFSHIAFNSNEQTNVTGSTQKTTTGGWSDTAGRRMISNIGCEDCCGQYMQCLSTASLNNSLGTTGAWANQAPFYGSIYSYGTGSAAATQLIAGGLYSSSTNNGSMCRSANNDRMTSQIYVASRFCCDPL